MNLKLSVRELVKRSYTQLHFAVITLNLMSSDAHFLVDLIQFYENKKIHIDLEFILIQFGKFYSTPTSSYPSPSDVLFKNI